MANLHTTILDFGGFDSGRILMPRGGILLFVWNFQEILSQAILVGINLVGRLGVVRSRSHISGLGETLVFKSGVSPQTNIMTFEEWCLA